MAVVYEFRCDACPERGSGVAGDYLYPDPPLGWVWRFGSSLEGPHACSRKCWDKVKWTSDGKLYLHMDHEKLEARHAPTPPEAPPPSAPVDVRPVGRSWVYFAQRGDSGPIKIGFSRNVPRRIGELERQERAPLRVLATFEGTRQDEAYLHKMYSAHRLHGEWFRPAAEILQNATNISSAQVDKQ